MRKVWVFVLAMTLALIMTGCGKDDGKAVQGEKAKEEKAAVKMLQEMSATVVNVSGGKTMTSKFYMKDGKVRMEMEAAGGMYTIVRKDLKKVWMIMPSAKSYMEIEEGKEQQRLPEEKMKGEVSRKEVGKEVVDGHPTTKYEITTKVEEKSMTFFQWLATDINFPVKTAATDGSWTMEYKDIKIGGQPDSLFELPEGYKKTAIPSAAGSMKIPVPAK
jgi:outer membrane lipoprotein-sorting protein